MTNDRKRITVRIPLTLYEAILRDSKELGVTVNGFIIQVLREQLQVDERKEDSRSQ